MAQPPDPSHPGPIPADASADPSMDDILASIRRILNEDETKATPPPDDDVFLLDQSMMVPESPALPPPPPPPPPELLADPQPQHVPPVEAGAQPLPVMTPQAAEPAPLPEPHAGLVAPAAAAAAASSVGALLRTLATERSTAVHRGGPTIEDLVRDEMRPLLKEWLDTHLPPLVERLVRAEIERVVGRMAP